MIRKVIELSPTAVSIEVKPEPHEYYCPDDHGDGCWNRNCAACYDVEVEPPVEQKLDYDYGEPFLDDAELCWVERTHKGSGRTEVVSCDYEVWDRWGYDTFLPHDLLLFGLAYASDLVLPPDLNRGRLERAGSQGNLVCIAVAIGTVRHALLWYDEQRKIVYAAKSFDKVGPRLACLDRSGCERDDDRCIRIAH